MTQSQATREERILQGRDAVLKVLASGARAEMVLEKLSDFAEDLLEGAAVSCFLIEEGRISVGVPGQLPVELANHLVSDGDGSPLWKAARQGKRLIIEDLSKGQESKGLCDLFASYGYRSSWAEPVLSRNGEVQGAIVIHRTLPSHPDAFETKFVHSAAQIAGMAIEVCRTQASLRESELRFRQLAENIEEVFWLTDWRENRVLYVSKAYETIWGRDAEELYADSHSWVYPIHPDDRGHVQESFARDAAEGTYDVVYRIQDAEGNERWIHDRAFPIKNERGEVYRVCGISADITRLKRRENARRLKDKQALQSMTSELLLAEERERRNLAEDLHDGPNQTLTLAQMKLDSMLETAPDMLRDELSYISDLVKQANQEARSLTFQLSPPVLHDLGFEAAVQWLVEDIQRGYGLNVTLSEDANEKPLDERIRLLLFRAVRELLINVAKHAQAQSAEVQLEASGKLLRLRVLDDGASCEPSHLESGRGLGLRTIRERLTRMGGRMEVISAPNRGTSVTLYAPLLGQKQ